MTLLSAAPSDQIAGFEFLAVFLVFVAIVLLSGLAYAWRYRRLEGQRRKRSSAERNEQRTADVVVVLSAIENLGTVDEPETGLQVDLQGEHPTSAAATGPAAAATPPIDEAPGD